MKIATFDIGSNTVLMLAAEVDEQRRPRVLAELMRITRMGRGVDKNKRLDPNSAASTLAALEEFAGKARDLGVERMVAAATAALRDASDGPEFIARVKERAGLTLQIIPGSEEAALSHLAVVRGLNIDPASPLLIVDIGGGSTELIRAEPGKDLAMVSLQIGSVRLTERCVSSDPPSDSDAASVASTVDSALDQLGWNYRPANLVGIAGTVTTLCAVALGLRTYEAGVVHGHRLPRAEIERVIKLIRSMPLADRLKLPGLPEGRADVIFAGATILERVMKRFSAADVMVSDQGVRWGLMWREIDRLYPPE
ncbi:MAG TPA: Ppx/GppA phosphatase family protein [Candidatus Binataceae bacterium]|nr:Ppx/GppA phosphatase family protein [Candidatus Binataceae bacterium]